jgi:hypothetical protein
LQLEAVKIVERALQNARLVDDNTLIEECCTIIWNASQPLLQPDTRMSLYRALSSAASALAAINSQR